MGEYSPFHVKGTVHHKYSKWSVLEIYGFHWRGRVGKIVIWLSDESKSGNELSDKGKNVRQK